MRVRAFFFNIYDVVATIKAVTIKLKIRENDFLFFLDQNKNGSIVII